MKIIISHVESSACFCAIIKTKHQGHMTSSHLTGGTLRHTLALGLSGHFEGGAMPSWVVSPVQWQHPKRSMQCMPSRQKNTPGD